MPLLSCFTGFGFLEFSSAPSECEKVYNSLIAGFRNPQTGAPTIDTSMGTYQEAKIFAWANAIAAARVTVMRAGNELRAETSYETLEMHEAKFGMTPAATETVADRRADLALKQKVTRGPRYEAVWEGLLTIFGSNLVAYRPIATTEAVAYPPNPRLVGNFRRPDTIAATLRLTSAVARSSGPMVIGNQYATQTTTLSIGGSTTKLAQVFIGDGRLLSRVSIPLKRTGTPTGNITVTIAEASGSADSYTPGNTLATSATVIDAATLTTGLVTKNFDFFLDQQITLQNGMAYCIVVSAAPPTDSIQWGADGAFAGDGIRNMATYNAPFWTATSSLINTLVFAVYTGYAAKAFYENWNKSLVEQRVVAGDIVVVDSGNWGLVDKVYVIDAGLDEGVRWMQGTFRRPHSKGAHATTGPAPLWSNTKRHVFVVVKAAAAVDETMLSKVNAFFRNIMRAPTTWAIVQETTPGSGTIGPLKIGDTLGSPLGCTPVESITL